MKTKYIRVMDPKGWHKLPEGLRNWAKRTGISPKQLMKHKDKAIAAWRARPRLSESHDVWRTLGSGPVAQSKDYSAASLELYCTNEEVEHDGHIGISKLVNGSRYRIRAENLDDDLITVRGRMPDQNQFYKENPNDR